MLFINNNREFLPDNKHFITLVLFLILESKKFLLVTTYNPVR